MIITAMRQALEALENCEATLLEQHQWLSNAQCALRAAIEQAEKAKPVATKLPTRAFSCFHVSAEDFGKLKALPDGTALYPHPAPVPAGWQLVPVEPTKAMLSAGWGNDHLYADLYKAMLQAAPKPGEMK